MAEEINLLQASSITACQIAASIKPLLTADSVNAIIPALRDLGLSYTILLTFRLVRHNPQPIDDFSETIF